MAGSREIQDDVVLPPEQRTIPHENRIGVLLSELLKGRLKVVFAADVEGQHFESAGRRRVLGAFPIISSPAPGRILQHRDSEQRWDDLLQDVKLFGKTDVPREACHIRAWPERATHKTVSHRVNRSNHHDRYIRHCSFHSGDRWIPCGDDYVEAPVDHFGREPSQVLVVLNPGAGRSELNCDVQARGEARFTQALLERLHQMSPPMKRNWYARQVADAVRSCRLLGLSCNWGAQHPERESAEERAAVHYWMISSAR